MGKVRTTASTVGSIQAADVFGALVGLGALQTPLLRSAGLTKAALEDADARFPTTCVLSMFDHAQRELGDPIVGLRAGMLVQTRGPLFYLVLSSPKLSEGLSRFARFARVSLDSLAIDVRTEKGLVHVAIDPGDPVIARNHHAVDYLMTANFGIFRRSVPGLTLLSVDLAHEEKGLAGESARLLGCPVRFDRRQNVLRFADADLEKVPAAANELIASQVEQLSNAILARVSARSATGNVEVVTRALVARGRRADRGAVARQLGASERTLQRQLATEGRTFVEVRDGVLFELARSLLINREIKIDAIAGSLGFADLATFSKAFSRWSGYSPTQYRNRLGRLRLQRTA